MVLDHVSSVYEDAVAELQERPEDYITDTEATDLRFHGTIMEASADILEEGVLEPATDSTAGENPQDVVCATHSFTTALVYAEDGTPEIDEELNSYVNEMLSSSHAVEDTEPYDLRQQADRARFAEQVAAIDTPYGGIEGHLTQLGERITQLPGIDRTPMVVAFDDTAGSEESHDGIIVCMGEDDESLSNNEVHNYKEGNIIAEERYDAVDLSDATFYVPHENMDELDEVYPERQIRSLEAQELAHMDAMADTYEEEGRLEYDPVTKGERPLVFDAETVSWDGESISRYTGQ